MRLPSCLSRLFLVAAAAGATFPPPAQAAEACPIVSSRNWHAWIDRFPGKGVNRIVVTGRIALPTAGYGWRLVKAGGLRGRPPLQEFRLELVPPSGMAAEVITEVDVRGEAKTPFSNLRVMVSCGGKRIAFFDQVVVTD